MLPLLEGYTHVCVFSQQGRGKEELHPVCLGFFNEKWSNIALKHYVQIHMETIKRRWKSMVDWPYQIIISNFYSLLWIVYLADTNSALRRLACTLPMWEQGMVRSCAKALGLFYRTILLLHFSQSLIYSAWGIIPYLPFHCCSSTPRLCYVMLYCICYTI